MNAWRILLDLDGTVAQNAGRRLAAEQFGIDLSDEENGVSLPDLLGLTAEEFWAWWQANQAEIYGLATPLDGASRVVSALFDAGAHIAVVTARRAEARELTEPWLAHHGFPYHEIVFAADDKPAVAAALGLNLAFEDDPENALALARVMPVVLIENFKNRRVLLDHPQIHRVEGWHQVEALLQNLRLRSA